MGPRRSSGTAAEFAAIARSVIGERLRAHETDGMCPDLPMECFRIKVACVRTFWSPWTTERLNHSAGARRRHIPPHQPKAEFDQQLGWRSARLDRPGVDLCGRAARLGPSDPRWTRSMRVE